MLEKARPLALLRTLVAKELAPVPTPPAPIPPTAPVPIPPTAPLGLMMGVGIDPVGTAGRVLVNWPPGTMVGLMVNPVPAIAPGAPAPTLGKTPGVAMGARESAEKAAVSAATDAKGSRETAPAIAVDASRTSVAAPGIAAAPPMTSAETLAAALGSAAMALASREAMGATEATEPIAVAAAPGLITLNPA